MNTEIKSVKEKYMPVHSTSRKMLGLDKVPFALFNEEWASWNHGQTLDRLAERGGLGILEMLDNIRKRKLSQRNENENDAKELLSIIHAQFKSEPIKSNDVGDVEKAAENYANEEGYLQSDKSVFETTYWTEHNIAADGFKAGAEYIINQLKINK